LIVKTLEILQEFLVGLQKVGIFCFKFWKKGYGPDIGIFFEKKKKLISQQPIKAFEHFLQCDF